jgi:hypothetical protein
LLGLFCLCSGCGATEAIASQPVSAINVAGAQALAPARLGELLATLQDRGVRVVRSDIPWQLIQPRRPHAGNPGWSWARPDAWVSAFARHGLTWEPILDYSAGWAKTCPGFCAPASNSTYAAFARAVAARYGVGGAFWRRHPQVDPRPVQAFEIWNEENVPTYYISPARYALLYAAARTAIHAVDPTARVIVGGLADDAGSYSARRDYPSQYVLAMYAASPSLVGHVDGFGLHPFGATASDVEEWTVHFRQTLDALGERTAPIYLTEFGWPVGTPLGESWRAGQMQFLGTALAHSNCAIRLVAPYDAANPGAVPGVDFGLASAGARRVSLRPAGVAWFRALAKPHAELRLCPGGLGRSL